MSNRSFEGAKRKGRDAALAGKPRSACPYSDWRKDDGRLTFSRAFIRAWLSGYDEVKRASEVMVEDGFVRAPIGDNVEEKRFQRMLAEAPTFQADVLKKETPC